MRSSNDNYLNKFGQTSQYWKFLLNKMTTSLLFLLSREKLCKEISRVSFKKSKSTKTLKKNFKMCKNIDQLRFKSTDNKSSIKKSNLLTKWRTYSKSKLWKVLKKRNSSKEINLNRKNGAWKIKWRESSKRWKTLKVIKHQCQRNHLRRRLSQQKIR